MSEHGGARTGAGRPKGGMNAATKRAMKAKKMYEDRARKHVTALLNAQLSLATGVQMLFVIHTDSKGVRRKPEMITDPETIKKFLDENKGRDGVLKSDAEAKAKSDSKSKVEDYYFLTTKVPDTKTISDMLDRIFGKAPATLDLTSGGERLTAAPLIVSDITTAEEAEDNEAES